MLNDGAHNYQFDPEGRIKCMDAGWNCSSPAALYEYSIEGRRVKRTASGATTLYLHQGGSVLSEFAYTGGGSGTWKKDYIYLNGQLLASESPTDGTRYHFSDHLGTPRLVTDATGAVVARHDYYPYGKEITSWSDGETHKFTGKERDSESNLDYFGARYFSALQGRFLTVDPVLIRPDRLLDPQRINLYGYARNNPMAFIDPDGRDVIAIGFTDYKVQTGTGLGRVSGLGHAGFVTINSRGKTRYFEFGRYEGPKGSKAPPGRAREVSVVDVQMGRDGKPTQKSLNNLLTDISRKSGQDGKVEGAYFKADDKQTEKANDYAEGVMAKNESKDKDPYSLTGNNCGYFVNEALKAAGLSTPWFLADPRPNSMIEEWQEEADSSVTYDPKASKKKDEKKKKTAD